MFDVALPSTRKDVVQAAFDHGCDVLTEKPMAASMADARTILKAAGAAERLHAVTQNRRFKDSIRPIKRALSSGVIGEVSALHCDFFVGAHLGGFRDEMEHVLLLDMAIHTFDAARYMSGEDAVAVFCQETNPKGSWYSHDAAANAMFQMTNDVVFTYRGSWAAEGANTSWEATWRIVGSKGTLLWDGEDAITVHVRQNAAASDQMYWELNRGAIPEEDLAFGRVRTGVGRDLSDGPRRNEDRQTGRSGAGREFCTALDPRPTVHRADRRRSREDGWVVVRSRTGWHADRGVDVLTMSTYRLARTRPGPHWNLVRNWVEVHGPARTSGEARAVALGFFRLIIAVNLSKAPHLDRPGGVNSNPPGLGGRHPP